MRGAWEALRLSVILLLLIVVSLDLLDVYSFALWFSMCGLVGCCFKLTAPLLYGADTLCILDAKRRRWIRIRYLAGIAWMRFSEEATLGCGLVYPFMIGFVHRR